MSKIYAESTYVKILKEICFENNIEMKAFSYDYIFELKKNGVIRYILGYQFDLNTAAVQAICKDKSAVSDILSYHNIPCVEHYFFISPENINYLGVDGSWQEITKLRGKYSKIVCKPNEGTGGNDVFLVRNQKELEFAVNEIFKRSRGMAVSPYYDISAEYRVIILNNKTKLIFSKKRPHVTGDGISTLAKLIYEYIDEGKSNELSINLNEKTYQTILEAGEKFSFNWRHNLGHGAVASVLKDKEIENKLKKLAKKTTKTLNLKFASIDIIRTNDEYKVLEINSGVMMEHFSSQNEEYYNKAKIIYKEAMDSMFDIVQKGTDL